MLSVTISGSFRKAIEQVIHDKGAFERRGAQVLSPIDPHITGWLGDGQDFALLEGDMFKPGMSTGDIIRLNQDRHFRCINASDLLWLVAPHGYVGTSTVLEIGAAIRDVPIFCANEVDTSHPDSWLLRGRITVATMAEALDYAARHPRRKPPPHVMVDRAATFTMAARLEAQIAHILATPRGQQLGHAHPAVRRRQTAIWRSLELTSAGMGLPDGHPRIQNALHAALDRPPPLVPALAF